MRLTEILKHDVEVEREIYFWLAQNGVAFKDLKNFSFSDGVVNSDGDVTLKRCHDLPYKFGTVADSFFAENSSFTSFANFPSRVGGSVVLGECQLLTSLKGIHRVVKEVGFNRMTGRGVFEINYTPIKEAILGLLLIKGVGRVRCFGENSLEKAVHILNKHLGQGKAGVLTAQQALLDAGLDDYAQL